MVYDFIPIILILLSLVIIIVIIFRRFSDIKGLDVSSIAEERESQIKKRIITERLQRKTDEFRMKVSPWMKTILKFIETIIKKIYFKIIELEQSYKEKEFQLKDGRKSKDEKINEYLEEALRLYKDKNLIEAEKKYLETIGLNNKKLEAYQGLGEVYLEKKDNDQAIETFQFIVNSLKRNKDITDGQKHLLAVSNFDLALIHKDMGNNDKALKYLEQSIKIEPNNPRYLDLNVEMCIILKDKEHAFECLKRLKKANPDNVKIKEFSDKIKEI